MAKRYWTGAHTKHRLKYHLVWIPKYRKRVLRGKIATRITELFYEACKINKWYIEELNIQLDHVHMLIQIKPSDRVSDVVKFLKGGSSRKVREEYPELEEFYWGNSFWCDGYFAETVGQVNESVIRRYIREQQEL